MSQQGPNEACTGQEIAHAASLARVVAEFLNLTRPASVAALVAAYAPLLADVVNAIESGSLTRDAFDALIADALTKASDEAMKKELGTP